MDRDELTVTLALVGVVIGSILMAVGLGGGLHVLTLLGMIVLPAAILYALLGGYSSSRVGQH